MKKQKTNKIKNKKITPEQLLEEIGTLTVENEYLKDKTHDLEENLNKVMIENEGLRWRHFDFDQILEILPINEITIKNKGIIKNAKIKFTPGLNIIMGRAGEGKTTVVKALLEQYGLSNISTGQRTIFDVKKALGKTTLVIDHAFSVLAKENMINTLNELASSGRQVILTLYEGTLNNEEILKIKANVVHTRDFELTHHNR